MMGFGKMFFYSAKFGTRLFFERFRKVPLIGSASYKLMKKMAPTVFYSTVSHFSGVGSCKPGEVDSRSVEYYYANLKLANTLCAAQTTVFTHFFQPLLVCGNKPMTENERRIYDREPDADKKEANLFYDMFEKDYLPLPDFANISLRKAFDAVNEESFIDSGHLNSKGNEIIAQHIAQYMTPQLN